MSDTGYDNGEFVPSPTVNSYVVGVMVAPPPSPGSAEAILPVISSLVPATEAVDTELELSVLGTNFANNAVVWWDDNPAGFTLYENHGLLTAYVTTPASPGNIDVWVEDSGGESNHVTFTVTA